MKYRFLFFALMTGAVVLAGCSLIGGAKPAVVISSPPSGSTYHEGDDVAVQSTSADQAGIGDRMMRRTKGAGGNQRPVGGQQTQNTVDSGDFNRLLEGEVGKNRGDAFGQHRFPRPRGADHDDIVPAGGRDLQGSFHMFLSLDLIKIFCIMLVPLE